MSFFENLVFLNSLFMNKYSLIQTENIQSSIDKTWIVSGQSPSQKKLLQEHDKRAPVILEGGEHVWLRKKRITYFVLKSEDHPITIKPPTPLYGKIILKFFLQLF